MFMGKLFPSWSPSPAARCTVQTAIIEKSKTEFICLIFNNKQMNESQRKELRREHKGCVFPSSDFYIQISNLFSGQSNGALVVELAHHFVRTSSWGRQNHSTCWQAAWAQPHCGAGDATTPAIVRGWKWAKALTHSQEMLLNICVSFKLFNCNIWSLDGLQQVSLENEGKPSASLGSQSVRQRFKSTAAARCVSPQSQHLLSWLLWFWLHNLLPSDQWCVCSTTLLAWQKNQM